MKTIESIIENITRCDMSYAMRNAANAGAIIQIYRESLEKFLELVPNADITVSGTSITLEGADRSTLMKFLQCFGGDWEKKVNDYYKDKMDYVQEHLHPLRNKSQDFEIEENINEETGEITSKKVPYKWQRKFSIVVSAVAPPPSCKIIEEEVEVPATPARKEIRKKVICVETPETITNES